MPRFFNLPKIGSKRDYLAWLQWRRREDRREEVPTYDAGALLDWDFERSVFWYNGKEYNTETSLMTAIGAAQSGITRTISPKVVGAELLADPGFDAGVTGWANGATFETAGTISWDSVAKRLKIDVPTRTGAGSVLHRAGIAVATAIGKAYRYQLRSSQVINAGGWNLGLHPANTFGGQVEPAPVNRAIAAGELIEGYSGANAATMYLGKSTNSNSLATEYWDDQSVREVVPLVGHDHTKIAVSIEAITPAAAGAGSKVLFSADCGGSNGQTTERFRLRIEWDSTKHLRAIITSQNTEQANLDLGVVNESTSFQIEVSSTNNSFKANLNGGPILSDTSGQHPAMAFIRIGRSSSGEVWDGSINRVRLYAATLSDAEMTDPLKAFFVAGDSTANGDGTGVTTKWYDALRNSYSPARSVFEIAQGGETSTQMLARVVSDTEHREWTAIFMDRPNTGEDPAVWIANMKAAAAHLKTHRWFVMPPVQNSPSGPQGIANITSVQELLLSDPDFEGHTLDETEQAAYIAEMNDDATRVTGDWIHFSNAGQALQASRIKAFLDGRGW